MKRFFYLDFFNENRRLRAEQWRHRRLNLVAMLLSLATLDADDDDDDDTFVFWNASVNIRPEKNNAKAPRDNPEATKYGGKRSR